MDNHSKWKDMTRKGKHRRAKSRDIKYRKRENAKASIQRSQKRSEECKMETTRRKSKLAERGEGPSNVAKE